VGPGMLHGVNIHAGPAENLARCGEAATRAWRFTLDAAIDGSVVTPQALSRVMGTLATKIWESRNGR
jgi:hypothetical protein